MPMVNKEVLPAIPSALTSALLFSTLTYITQCANSAISQDPVRHGGSAKPNGGYKSGSGSSSSDGMGPRVRQGGPQPPPPVGRGQCHHIHAQHCARYDNKTDNIQLFRGPAGTWDSRATDSGLTRFLINLLPLTQILEIIFKCVRFPCWEKYDKVKKAMPDGMSGSAGLGHCFGLWRSRAIVIDSVTNLHRDLDDVCYGWCAIAPLGDFRGGDVCLPRLGYKITLPVGMLNLSEFFILF